MCIRYSHACASSGRANEPLRGENATGPHFDAGSVKVPTRGDPTAMRFYRDDFDDLIVFMISIFVIYR
jgi:hypothetical protein